MSKLEPWKTLKSDIVFDHRWYRLRRDHVELPGGQVLDDYFVSVRPDVAIVFALTPDQQVLFVRQYKHAAGRILTELPGGLIDKAGDEPLTAAKRELLEETGYTSDHVELLLSIIDNPTRDTSTTYLYLAHDVRRVAEQSLDETENIEVLQIPLAEVEAHILRGDIRASSSVMACLLALRHLQP